MKIKSAFIYLRHEQQSSIKDHQQAIFIGLQQDAESTAWLGERERGSGVKLQTSQLYEYVGEQNSVLLVNVCFSTRTKENQAMSW